MNLTDVNLTRAHLTGADLTGADLTGADLTRAVLTNAKWPIGTLVPEGWEQDADSGRLAAVGGDSASAELN